MPWLASCGLAPLSHVLHVCKIYFCSLSIINLFSMSILFSSQLMWLVNCGQATSVVLKIVFSCIGHEHGAWPCWTTTSLPCKVHFTSWWMHQCHHQVWVQCLPSAQVLLCPPAWDWDPVLWVDAQHVQHRWWVPSSSWCTPQCVGGIAGRMWWCLAGCLQLVVGAHQHCGAVFQCLLRWDWL